MIIENKDVLLKAYYDLKIIDKQIEKKITQDEFIKLCYVSPFSLQLLRLNNNFFIFAIEIDFCEDYFKKFDLFLNSKLISESDSFEKKLRYFRKIISVNIIYQMLIKQTEFEIISKHLSLLAETLIELAHQKTIKEINERFNLNEKSPNLIILGMGKLGGFELNFSSDVDLIFLYDEKDQIQERFYILVAQRLIQILDNLTVDGFVYRVDMRLRPFGQQAPLVCSIAQFEKYLINHARDWERYALLKARILSNKNINYQKVMQLINRFVYRKYIDYQMLDSIRQMKGKILAEVIKQKAKDNIKLGRGGIREIEFIVQCYQLIYGGQNKTLKTTSLKEALFQLAEFNHLSTQVKESLWQNYVFLRDIENMLQMINDQQRHQLPRLEIDQSRLSLAFNRDSWENIAQEIKIIRTQVEQYFDQLTRFDEAIALNKVEKSLNDHSKVNINKVKENKENNQLIILYELFKNQVDKKSNLSESAKTMLDQLLDLFFNEIESKTYSNKEALFQASVKLLRAVSRRTTYLYLLLEYKDNIHNLLTVMNYGPWFSERLIQYPFLLEVVFLTEFDKKAHQTLYLDKNDYQKILKKLLTKIDLKDHEATMETLRRFKVEQVFKTAISQLTQTLSLMEASDVLSALAEVVIEEVLNDAWLRVKEKYRLSEKNTQQLKNALAVIAYGKLGGFELGFGSDLDLIFLYQANDQLDDSEKIFAKVLQQFVSLMQRQTYSDRLYEIDLRLRPSGETGLLVSSFEAFYDYQLKQAWVWEHQALTRARLICGSEELKKRFDLIREEILSKKKNKSEINQLKKEIHQMRQKMNDNLYKKMPGFFDIKYSDGGMLDIEFIAQFMTLAFSQQYAEISLFTDNIRIFQSMETAKLLERENADLLIKAYCYYRDLIYDSVFHQREAKIKLDKLKPYNQKVRNIYKSLLLS